jgi:hypothetical protein
VEVAVGAGDVVGHCFAFPFRKEATEGGGIADLELQIADCRLQIADCKLQIAD